MFDRIGILLSLLCLFGANVGNSQNFWQKADGPYSGSVSALTIASNGSIYAGTSRGIFYSKDDATTWIACSNGIGNPSITALACTAGGFIFAAASSGKVYRSAGDGQAWIEMSSGVEGLPIFVLAVNNQKGYIFAASWDGKIFRTSNNGTYWSPLPTGWTTQDIEALAVTSSGRLFAGAYNGGVFRSDDDGYSWVPVNTGLTNNNIVSLAVNVQGDLFAGTWGGYLFRSTDNGAQWQQLKSGLSAAYLNTILIAPSGELFLAAEGNDEGIYRSTNNGDKWTLINNGLDLTEIKSLAISSTGTLYAGSEGAGIYRSLTKGDTWTSSNEGFTANIVQALVACSDGSILAGTEDGVFRSSDGLHTWTRVPSIFTYRGVQELASNGLGHIFASSGYPFRSTDHGTTWKEIKTGLPVTSVTTFTFFPENLVFAGSYWEGAFRSINNGDSWTEVNNGLPENSLQDLAMSADAELFAGTGEGIFRSSDFGDHWIPVNSGLPDFMLSITTLVFDPKGYLFAGDRFDGVFRSTDNGDHWTATGLTNMEIMDLAVNSLGHLFASNTRGVWRSYDDGDSWYLLDQGLTQSDVRSLLIGRDQHLYAGTCGGGLFRSLTPTNTLLPPESPQLVVPLDGAVDRPIDLIFKWLASSGASFYHLQVATDSNYTRIIFDDATMTATTYELGPFDHNTTYYWHVRASGETGASAWSKTRSFTTLITCPAAILLASPHHTCATTADSMLLCWHPGAPSVTKYCLEVATNASMAAAFVDSSLAAIDTCIIIRRQPYDQTYWWRVKGKNIAGWGPFSEIRAFRFNTTEVSQTRRLPAKFALLQNYPNPFNSTTEICFELPSRETITVSIFNTRGAEICILVDHATYEPGSHTLSWDGRDWHHHRMASGIYLCRIVAEKFTQTRKMSLLQ